MAWLVNDKGLAFYLSRLMTVSALSPCKYIYSTTLLSSKTPCALCGLVRRYLTAKMDIFNAFYSSAKTANLVCIFDSIYVKLLLSARESVEERG